MCVCVCVCGYMFQQFHGYPQDAQKQKLQMHKSVKLRLKSKALILQNATTPKKEFNICGSEHHAL